MTAERCGACTDSSASRVSDDVVAVLRDGAAKTERSGRLAPDSVEALSAAGIFALPVPRRFGGLQASLPDQVDVLGRIAHGCGSTAWCTAIYFTGAWVVSLMPQETAEEVFAVPGVRTSIVSAPTGTLTRRGEDYHLTGSWSFNTGIHHADWDLLGAMLDGRHMLALVPRHEVVTHDDWDTCGLQGTGSESVSVGELTVPTRRVLPFPTADEPRPESHPCAREDFYHYELFPFLSALNCGPPVGLATAAEEFLIDRAGQRGITFTRYTSQREAAITHRQLSQARLSGTAAGVLVGRLASKVEDHARRRLPLSTAERAEARALAAYATQLAREAVETVQGAAGASSIRRDVPLQRITRDALAMSLHAALNIDSALEIHGRALLGLPTETTFL